MRKTLHSVTIAQLILTLDSDKICTIFFRKSTGRKITTNLSLQYSGREGIAKVDVAHCLKQPICVSMDVYIWELFGGFNQLSLFRIFYEKPQFFLPSYGIWICSQYP